MRSPEDMKIIEIDITNACIHTCSNCTRMCGHHKKPYFMDFETFKRAVDSLEGFEGGIGMMGGEPTLHPEFERFAEYLASKYLEKKEHNYFIQPTAHFMRDRKLEERNRTYTYIEKNGVGQRVKGPVLFSSLASNYHYYYETIQDVFCYQGINDHAETCLHQPILVTRKDMEIPDEEWIKLRDNCWMQNVWSASITPKGCFFCEIAGVLDMLFDGPGRWAIEPGWWKRKPEEFEDQLHWCELCGVALNTRSRDANEGIDDASETMYQKIKELNTPKFQKGLVHLYTKEDIEQVREGDNRKFQYHENNMNRLTTGNSRIYPDGFFGVMISDGNHEAEIACIIENCGQFKKMIVFIEEEYMEEYRKQLIEKFSEKEIDEIICLKKRQELWGSNLNYAHEMIGKSSYIVLITAGVRLKDSFTETMKKYVINPGTYHYLDNSSKEGCGLIQFEESNKKEYFVLYSPESHALRSAGYDGIKFNQNEKQFRDHWDKDKTVLFNDAMLHGRVLINQLEYEKDCKYVVFGTGTYGEKAYQGIKEIGADIVFFVDSNPAKQGKKLHGYEVKSPDVLKTLRSSYDKVVIAAIAYKDIREKILAAGMRDEDIIAPIF